MEDSVLVEAACEGDKDAFAGIYDRYSDPIYSFLCTVVRDRDEAADLLQDTFLTAGSRLSQLRDPAKLRPWLYAIARHLAMKSLSRSSKTGPLDDDIDIADSGPEPDEVAEQSELAALIQEASSGLNAQDRVVLDLHLRQGLEGQELGEALGVSSGHAYVLLSRMRDQIERSLGALLVARQGDKECASLRKILKGWDGKFTALWRKRVARHVDSCEICGEVRKRALAPMSMMGVIPLIPAPASARGAVLENLDLVGFGGEPWSADGFPPADEGLVALAEKAAQSYGGGDPPSGDGQSGGGGDPGSSGDGPDGEAEDAGGWAGNRRRLAWIAAALIALLALWFGGASLAQLIGGSGDTPQTIAPELTIPLVFNSDVLRTPEPEPTPEEPGDGGSAGGSGRAPAPPPPSAPSGPPEPADPGEEAGREPADGEPGQTGQPGQPGGAGEPGETSEPGRGEGADGEDASSGSTGDGRDAREGDSGSSSGDPNGGDTGRSGDDSRITGILIPPVTFEIR